MKRVSSPLYFRSIPIILIFILLSSGFVFSQTKIDSLLSALKTAKKDTNKVLLLNEICAAYFTQDKEKTIRYNAEALALAKELRFLNGEAKATNNLGILLQKNGDYDSSLVIQLKALELYKQINNKKGIAKTYSDICIVYWRRSEFAKALDMQLKSLRLYEEIKDQKGIGYSYNMIGIIYKNLDKPDEALRYYLRSVGIRKFTDERGLASTYQNIGNVYKHKKNEDSAMYYYARSLALHKKYGNVSSEAMVTSSMGDLKFEFKKFKEAKEYYLLCLEIDKDVVDSNTLATTYINIGNAYSALRDFKTGEDYINKGLDILNKLGDKEGVMSAYEMLAYLFQEAGNDKQALSYRVAYEEIKDSIMGNKEKQQIAELQTKYEVEKKDLELAKNKAELEAKEKQNFIKNIIIVSIIVLVLLIVIIASVVYRKKQVEQKAALNEELSRQKDIRSKAVIEAEEKERIRIAKDLHDGVGQLLSAAKLNLSSLESKLKISDKEQDIALKNAMSLVDDSVKEVRTVSHNMMPNTLLKLGLASAVKEFITKIQGMPTLKVNLEIVGMDNRLEQEKETVLYRVIQEIVANIIKHAKASELTLQLIRDEKELSIIIEDNGVGFDTSKINAFEGIGLKNIISRIEFINGSVHFDSTPGRGTNVIVEVPVV